MSEVKFSLPEFCERYEYVRRSTDQPIQLPAGNGAQRKNNYVFTLDDRTAIYDWSKAYFEVGFKVERDTAINPGGPANSAGKFHYTPGEVVSMINGVHSLIRRLTLQGPNGQVLYDCPEVNKALFLKKLLEFGTDFSETSASNELWYYDDSPLPTNTGAAKRNSFITTPYALGSSTPEVKARLPFNSYSFFDSLDFNNVLLSNMSLKLIVDFETDNNLIFKDAATSNGRVVITKFELWLPQLTLHASSAEKYIRSLDIPLRWTYMRERVERSSVFTLSEGRFRISGVNKPKKAFFYFVTTDRDESQIHNMYRYDSMFVNSFNFKNNNLALLNGTVTNAGAAGNNIGTVGNLTVVGGSDDVNNIGIGRTSILQRARLEFDDGSFYPHVEYGNDDIQRLYHDALEYSHRNDNLCCGSVLTRDKYKTLNSVIYFDLEYQKRSVVSDAKDMTFVFSLDAAPNAVGFIIYAILMYENDASFGRIDNQYVLLSEISK
jgi:hypothetical protein